MLSIPDAVYLFVIATVLAFLDFQVEGKYGWAAKLPCWRPKNPNSPLPRIYSWFMEGRPLTGYHVAFFSVAFVFFHYPFFREVSWNLAMELETISMFFLVMLSEDFLWFVWNPFYGLKRFNPQSIEWHKRWIGPIPTGYPILAAVSFVFMLMAIPFEGSDVLKDWGVTFGIFVGLTLISCLVSLQVRRGQA